MIDSECTFKGCTHTLKISESTETPNTSNLRMKKEKSTSSFSKSDSGERMKKKNKVAILLVAPFGLVAHIVPWLSLREFCYLQKNQ